MAEHLKVIKGGGGNQASIGTEKWSEKVRRDAKGLANKLDDGYMEMARLLWLIEDTPIDGDKKNPPIFRKWNYDSFTDYVEQELGIHRKRAQRLKAVWFNLEVRLNLEPEVKKRLVRLGFSKVRELIRVISSRNVEKWVEKGEELSYPKLCIAIRAHLEAVERRSVRRQLEASGEASDSKSEDAFEGTDGIPLEDDETPVTSLTSDDLHRRNYMLYTEQADIVDQALDRAKLLSGSDKKSHNLHLICLDFLAHNNLNKATQEEKLRWLAQIERIINLQLVVFDDGDVVYGLKTLDSAAKAD